MADLLSIFRGSIDKAHQKLKGVREDLNKAQRRWEELRTLSLPPEEIADCLLEMLERRSEDHRREHLLPRLLSLSGDLIAHGSDSAGLQNSSVLTRNQSQVSSMEFEIAIVLMFRPQLRTLLIDTVRKSGQKYGPTRAERQAELQQLERRIKELEDEEKSLVAQFTALQKEIEV